MSAPELLLLTGKPYSGKSTIAKKLASETSPKNTKHFSIGDRLRGIASGEIESDHTAAVRQHSEALKQHQAIADQELPVKLFTEFIGIHSRVDLVLLDGFPRYADRISGFQTATKEIGTKLLAVCLVDVSDDVVRQRASGREQRYADVTEDEAFITSRLMDYQQNSAAVFEQLGSQVPAYTLDGTAPIAYNMTVINDIYGTLSNS
jgi:adenylate kinase family enzyme